MLIKNNSTVYIFFNKKNEIGIRVRRELLAFILIILFANIFFVFTYLL